MSSPFACSDEMTTLPSGIKVAVARFNADDLIHTIAFSDSLRHFVEGAAGSHGVSLQQNNFSNVVRAIAAKKVQAYFLIVSEENCAPRFAGGAVQFPTVLTVWNGKKFAHYPATYYEDTYVSQEFRAQQGNADSQKWKGIGTYFRRARMERSITNRYGDAPYGMSAQGLVGECSSDNAPSIASLKNLGAAIAKEQTPILVFEDGILGIPPKQKITVEISGLANQTGEPSHPNIFIAQWSGENGEQIAASYTEAISTFTGEPVVRVQITSNGKLCDTEHLQDVLYALIEAGNTEVVNRGWIDGNNASSLSCTRIHALGEIEVVEVLKGIGAEPRILGENPMIPISISFANDASIPFVIEKRTQIDSSAININKGSLRRRFVPVAIAG